MDRSLLPTSDDRLTSQQPRHHQQQPQTASAEAGEDDLTSISTVLTTATYEESSSLSDKASLSADSLGGSSSGFEYTAAEGGRRKMGGKAEEANGAAGSQQKEMQRAVAEFLPPDGGCWAWLVMVCSFLCNGIIFGIINSFGVLFVYLKATLDEDAATKASLVGSITVGFTFLLSPVSSILSDRFGLRATACFGACLAFVGILLSSFFVGNLYGLYLTYGVLAGSGFSLCYTPSLVILGHYFRRRMGVVNGLVTAGSSLATIAMPVILEGFLESQGLTNCLRFLAGLVAVLMLATLSFKPLMPKHVKDDDEDDEEDKTCLAQLIHVPNWRNRKYVIWAVAIPLALFGYFVPYVHIVQYVKDLLPAGSSSFGGGKTLLMCIGVTSGLGRIIFGRVADLPRVNRILLQQISFVSIGLCCMLLTVAPHLGSGVQFPALILIALTMGLFDGCFISMLGPIAYDICGPRGASQGIGFLLGMCSVPLTLGPPIAGMLYDHFGNYIMAFLLAGCPPILGAAFMFLIYYVRGPETEATAGDQTPEAPPAPMASEEETAGLLATSASSNGIVKSGLHDVTTCTTFVQDDDDDDDDEGPSRDPKC